VTTTSPAARRGRSTVTQRLLAAVASTENRRSSLQEALDLVARIEPTRLLAVQGEKAVLEVLQERATALRRVLADLGDAPPARLEQTVARMEALLEAPQWPLLDTMLPQLRVSDRQVAEAITTLKSAYGLWRQQSEWLSEAVARAQQAGAVEIELTRTAREIESLVQQAEKDLESGNYGGMSVRLARIEEHISDGGRVAADAAAKQLLAQLENARDEAAPIGHRADLMLMQGPEGSDGVIEYLVLLRVPAVDLPQEVNLASQSVIVRMDRQELIDIIETITSAVDRGIRRAQSGTEPAAAASPAALPAPTTRRFDLGGSRATDAADDLGVALRDVGRLMYSLLVPDAMQRLIGDARCSLTLATNDMEMPWELLHDGREFLCIDRSMARMPLGGTFPRRRREQASAGSGETLRVLVIAADPYPNRPLPGAAEEARKIRERLEAIFGRAVTVKELIGPDATGRNLNTELRSGEHHVIHYAGHASFNADNPERSALLLADGEPYFAQKIQRILEGRPVVMINACDSGRTMNQPDDRVVTAYLAEENHGLASAFIYGGAAACVGALWPVHDDTAVDLAVSFYDHFLSGGRVGEALKKARARSRQTSPDRVTWASYALFGDPTYSLPFVALRGAAAPSEQADTSRGTC
jgi:CHAT domain-containing protein